MRPHTVVEPGTAEAIGRAVDSLRAGRLVAFPTDTVYGLGADPFNEQAIQAIYDAKDRPPVKPIPILVADLASLERFAGSLPPNVRALAERFWPGALTVVIAAPPGIAPSVLAGGTTIGVRIPDHPVATALLRAFGPLGVTSANRSGEPSLVEPDEVLRSLDGRIDLLIDGGRCPGGRESTVVEVLDSELRVLRAGAIAVEEIEAVIEG